jgi:hypothetical protein
VYSFDHVDRVKAGKAPLGDKWPERARQDPPECVRLPAVAWAANTGILADGMRPIDIDIDPPELAGTVRALALDMLGYTPMRCRENSGRSLLLYRAAEGSPRKRVLAGRLGKIEVLGHGQQFVSHGIHPTGAPLYWHPDPPELTPLDTLQTVTEEQITVFLAAAALLIGADAPADEPKANGQDGAHHDGAANHNILDVIAALAVIPNGDPADWEHWNRVGMATWAAADGSVHGFNAWAAWSSKHPQHDVAACQERWRHYPTSPPNQTGAGKLFRMASDAWPGWKRPSEGHTKDQDSPDPLWCDTDDWVEADIPKRPWIAPGRLLRGSVTLVTGPPSGMKSSLMLAWGISLALGIDVGRFHPAAPGISIVYNVEDDAPEQRRRLSAALRQFPGATPDDIRGKVIRTGPSGVGTLLTRDDAGRVHFTPAMARLERLIIQHKVDVLFVDPLSELHNSEENDNGALRAVIARFRELAVKHNIAVCILHHTRKGGAASPGDPETARGASAILGAVRIALTLLGMSEDDAKSFGLSTDALARSHYVRLDDAKQNYAAVRDAEWFEKIAHLLENGELVPAAEPWGPPPLKQGSQVEIASLA